METLLNMLRRRSQTLDTNYMRAVLSFALFALVACNRTPKAGAVIDHFGKFPSRDAHLTLKVSKQSTSIVAFDLLLATDGRSVFSDRIGSDAQRWCFYWDERNRLWAYSSDTGYFAVVTIQPDGSVQKSKVDKTTPLPKPIYDFLPSSLKRVWGI